MMRIRKLTATLLALLLVAGGAHALTLSDLFTPGSFLIIGDTKFDNWTLSSYTASDPARSFNPANISITPLTDGGMDPGPGLSFSVSNGELNVTGDGGYTFVDLMFGFRVSVLDPTLKIKDNTLAYGAGGAFWSISVDGSYDVGSFIREDVGTAAGLDDLGTKNIEFSTLDIGQGQQSTSKISDSATFAPQSEIWVTKDLLVWAVDATDSAGIFGFEQRFSQIPEPATLTLAALGLAGLAAMRRRKSV